MTTIPIDGIGTGAGFGALPDGHNCKDCSAPCCRMVILPYPVPNSWEEMDYIRYILGFRNMHIMVKSYGGWFVQVAETCRFLDTARGLCTVFNTPRRPSVCSKYDEQTCWYKPNFHSGTDVDHLLLDADRFERLLARLEYDAKGYVTNMPDWAGLLALTGENNADA